MKVYDCFMFFNELDLVELRFEELYDTVDYFVIAESSVTHAGNTKPFIFLDNWNRFEKYQNKIIHLKIEDTPANLTGMQRDFYQRDCLRRGLVGLDNEDLVIISDLDEVPRAELIEMIKEDKNNYDRYILSIPQFRHRFNFMKVKETHKYPNIIVTRFKTFTSPNTEREHTFFWNPKPPNSVTLEHGGWHFTWIGNDSEIKNKIKNYAHTEHNNDLILNAVDVNKHLTDKKSFFNENEAFEIVKIDDYFPKHLLENLDKYKNLIVPNGSLSVTDIYTE